MCPLKYRKTELLWLKIFIFEFEIGYTPFRINLKKGLATPKVVGMLWIFFRFPPSPSHHNPLEFLGQLYPFMAQSTFFIKNVAIVPLRPNLYLVRLVQWIFHKILIWKNQINKKKYLLDYKRVSSKLLHEII